MEKPQSKLKELIMSIMNSDSAMAHGHAASITFQNNGSLSIFSEGSRMDHVDGYIDLRTGESNQVSLKHSSATVYGVCNLRPKKKS